MKRKVFFVFFFPHEWVLCIAVYSEYVFNSFPCIVCIIFTWVFEFGNIITKLFVFRLDLGALLQKAQDPVTEAQYIAQYNQQATESLKNTIGVS